MARGQGIGGGSDTASPQIKPASSTPGQYVSGVEIRGKINQLSDVKVPQDVSFATASELDQKIITKQEPAPQFSAFGVRARGKVAVIVAGIVVVVFLLVKYFT